MILQSKKTIEPSPSTPRSYYLRSLMAQHEQVSWDQIELYIHTLRSRWRDNLKVMHWESDRGKRLTYREATHLKTFSACASPVLEWGDAPAPVRQPHRVWQDNQHCAKVELTSAPRSEWNCERVNWIHTVYIWQTDKVNRRKINFAVYRRKYQFCSSLIN